MAARKKTAGRKAAARGSAAKGGAREGSRGDGRAIEQYEHKGKERANNPQVGLVKPENDPDSGTRSWAYDPHLDPQLQWAGKAEHTSFEVPTVSLHVHERTLSARGLVDESASAIRWALSKLHSIASSCSGVGWKGKQQSRGR